MQELELLVRKLAKRDDGIRRLDVSYHVVNKACSYGWEVLVVNGEWPKWSTLMVR